MKIVHWSGSFALLLAAAVILEGCTVGPDYHRPSATVPEHYGPTASTQPTTRVSTGPAELSRWWTTFKDPTLERLVERAADANLDLQLAMARVREARAALSGAAAAFYPTLNANGNYNRTRVSKNGFSTSVGGSSATGTGTGTSTGGGTGTNTGGGTSTGTTGGAGTGSNAVVTGGNGRSEFDLFQTGFDSTWEIDVFGGVRRAVEAADADVQSQVENQRDVFVTLLGDVARYYIQLRGYQRQLAITRDNLNSQTETLKLTETRFKAGLVTEVDVARASALVQTTESQLPALEMQVATAVHRLSVLLGREPSALADELGQEGLIPVGVGVVPIGLPSDLLRRRADIRRAERQLAAANARIGVATADLFPKFSLTGSLGLQSAKFTNLPNSGSTFYSIGPGFNWNLFDAGKIRSNIRVQNALTEEAIVQYQQTVLNSLEEVENAIVAYDREQTRRQSLAAAVGSNKRAVDLSNELYSRGLIDFLSVQESLRSLLEAEDQLVQSDTAVSSNLVALYKALGGGWDETAN